jgi:hypothetical protein
MFDDFVGKPMTGGQKPEQREEQEGAQERAGGSGDLIGGLLGSILGGQGQEGGDDLGSLLGGSQGGGGDLGALLGGSSSGGIGDLLGGLLGGGSQSSPSFLGNNATANPLVDILADKLGVSKQTAGMIVSVAVPLVIGMLQKKSSEGSRGATRSGSAISLNELHDPDYLRSSGAVSQVASQTDMDEEEAAQRLQEAMDLLIGQAS